MNEILKTFNMVSVFKSLRRELLLNSKLALVNVQCDSHIVHRAVLQHV